MKTNNSKQFEQLLKKATDEAEKEMQQSESSNLSDSSDLAKTSGEFEIPELTVTQSDSERTETDLGI